MAATAEGNALTREQQDRMCRSKKKFRKQGDAIDSVIRSRQRGLIATSGRVYKCPVCTHYHVTSAGDASQASLRAAG